MSKQKIVIKFANDKKTRSKALKTAVKVSGVETVSLKEGQLEVIGVGIDAPGLINKMREKFGETRCCVITKEGYAELISVTPFKKDSSDNTTKEDKDIAGGKMVRKDCQCGYYPCHTPMYYYPVDQSSYRDPSCSIM